jgi:hypothetical protein
MGAGQQGCAGPRGFREPIAVMAQRQHVGFPVQQGIAREHVVGTILKFA